MSGTSSAPSSGYTGNTGPSSDYRRVVDALLSHQHVFFSPPTSPHKLLIPQKAGGQLPTISSLSLHPVLESILHLLNCDLPSAHFLCRHAEVSPKYESMYVHGVLHRIEGDIDNTRAWYGDVKDTDVFKGVWGADGQAGAEMGKYQEQDAPEIAKKGWKQYLDRLQRYRDRTKRRQNSTERSTAHDKSDPDTVTDWSKEEDLLRETSLWELRELLDVCEKKFGVREISDARSEFLGRIESGDEEHAKVAQAMVTGGEGWRTF